MEIILLLKNSENKTITGASASTSLALRRGIDDYYYDHDDGVFKASGWTSVHGTFDEINVTIMPGTYSIIIDESGFNDGSYQAYALYNDIPFLGEFSIVDGKQVHFTSADTALLIKAKTDLLPADPASITALGSLATASAVSDIDTVVDAIKTKTDNLPVDPASDTTVNTRLAAVDYVVVDNVGIAAIQAKTDNLPETPANETSITALTGKIDAIDGIVDSITLKTANIPVDPATVTKQDAILSAFNDVASSDDISVVSGKIDTLDTVADGIAAKTVNLPDDPASETTVLTRLAAVDYEESDVSVIAGEVTAIKARTDLLPDVPASELTLSSVSVKIDIVDTVVDAIKAKTDNLPDDPASEETVLTMLTDTDASTRFDTLDETLYDLTHSPEGESISRIIPPPVASGMCRLYEFVYNQPGDEAVESVTSTCRILGPYDSGNQLHTTETINGTYGVDEDHPELGPFLYFDVVWGARVAIEIDEPNINKTCIVPREATARIAKLRGI